MGTLFIFIMWGSRKSRRSMMDALKRFSVIAFRKKSVNYNLKLTSFLSEFDMTSTCTYYRNHFILESPHLSIQLLKRFLVVSNFQPYEIAALAATTSTKWKWLWRENIWIFYYDGLKWLETKLTDNYQNPSNVATLLFHPTW